MVHKNRKTAKFYSRECFMFYSICYHPQQTDSHDIYFSSATGRVHGQKFDADRHKKELEKLILSKQRQNDSGIEDDRDVDPDDALVLMGRFDSVGGGGIGARGHVGRRMLGWALLGWQSHYPHM